MNVDPDFNRFLEFLSTNEDIVIFGFISAVAIVWIIFGSIVRVFGSVQREHTRREIAAYIAEGSMTPDQGERLLKAGEKKDA